MANLGTTPDEAAHNLQRLTAQWKDLFDRVTRGTVPLEVARQHLQAAILGHPAPSSPVPDYFVSCARQVMNVQAWNKEYGWGFTDADFAKAYVEAATFAWPADALQAIVLVPSLASPVATFVGLCGVIADSGHVSSIRGMRRPTFRKGDYSHILTEHPDRLELAEGAEFHPNRLAWHLVDLGAFRVAHKDYSSHSALDRTAPSKAAHAEVIAAAAHFPRWCEGVRTKTAPSVYAPGYRVSGYRFDERKPDSTSPYLMAVCVESSGWLVIDCVTPHMSPNDAVATSAPMPLGNRLG